MHIRECNMEKSFDLLTLIKCKSDVTHGGNTNASAAVIASQLSCTHFTTEKSHWKISMTTFNDKFQWQISLKNFNDKFQLHTAHHWQLSANVFHQCHHSNQTDARKRMQFRFPFLTILSQSLMHVPDFASKICQRSFVNGS